MLGRLRLEWGMFERVLKRRFRALGVLDREFSTSSGDAWWCFSRKKITANGDVSHKVEDWEMAQCILTSKEKHPQLGRLSLEHVPASQGPSIEKKQTKC